MSKLALLGGEKAVEAPHPHYRWPPDADTLELEDLVAQRNTDISIAGRTGPIKAFEEAFLEFMEGRVKYAVTFNSGTSALLAAYFALGVRDGDEVIGPALTFHAALSPALILGASVRLVDIDKNTRCIDPDKVKEAITDKTKVLTVVHQWGHPCDMDRLVGIARRFNLFLLEDCSHAHASRYQGRLVGTFGDVAVFSLQAKKAVFAGEGGILVTNDPEIHDRATLLGHYRDRSRDEVVSKDLRKYWVTGFGQKLRMSPFNAIVALHSLRAFPERKQGRHKALTYFTQRLQEVSYIEPPYVANNVDMGAWYGYKPLYIKERLGNIPRPLLVKALRAEGVEVSIPSAPPVGTLPLYTRNNHPLFPGKSWHRNSAQSHPVARKVASTALSFPPFWRWPEDREIIDQYISAFLKIEDNFHELLSLT